VVAEFALGDVLTLRRTHPCGGTAWRVERLGADIGIRCLTCNHYLMLPRPRLERRMKQRVNAIEAGTPPDG